MTEKRSNKLLIIMISIFTALIVVATVVMTIYFKKSEVKNVLIPDVSNKSAVEASNILTDAGFDVEVKYKYVSSDTIEVDKVVKTSPEIGTKRKSGTKITLYLSSGEGVYVVEDFTGENYLVAKGKIEAKCNCNVVIETEKIAEKDKKKEDTVLKTIPAKGENSKFGEAITIVIPEIEYKYPDFTHGFTIATITEFAEKHELSLDIKYQENSSVAEGTILKQSRPKDSIVTPGANLIIYVSVLPEETGDAEEEVTD